MTDIMKDGPINPVKIQDNTFRDGHQSIYATRMRTEDMLPIAEQMEEILPRYEGPAARKFEEIFEHELKFAMGWFK